EFRKEKPREWWAMQGLNLRPHPCEGETACRDINYFASLSPPFHAFSTVFSFFICRKVGSRSARFDSSEATTCSYLDADFWSLHRPVPTRPRVSRPAYLRIHVAHVWQ